MCVLRILEAVNALLQYTHLYGRSPLCTCKKKDKKGFVIVLTFEGRLQYTSLFFALHPNPKDFGNFPMLC